jgi:hypothetical protein
LTIYLFPIRETKSHWVCDHPELQNLFGQTKTQSLKHGDNYKIGMLAIINQSAPYLNHSEPIKRFHFIKDLSDWRYQTMVENYNFFNQLDGIIDFRNPSDPIHVLTKWRKPTS